MAVEPARDQGTAGAVPLAPDLPSVLVGSSEGVRRWPRGPDRRENAAPIVSPKRVEEEVHASARDGTSVPATVRCRDEPVHEGVALRAHGGVPASGARGAAVLRPPPHAALQVAETATGHCRQNSAGWVAHRNTARNG